MSLEKIKERIKMIEDNDFNILNESYDTPITPDDYDTLTSDPNYQRSMINNIGKGGSANNRANQTIQKSLATDVRIVDGAISLSDKHNKIISEIYRRMDTLHLLSTDINKNYICPSGYLKNHANGSIIISQPKGDIQIIFKRTDLLDLDKMVIRNLENFDEYNVSKFYRDEMNNYQMTAHQEVIDDSNMITTIYIKF